MKNIKTLYATKVVSISDLRKDIKSYFIDEPVAVLSNNKPIGYLINEDAFGRIMDALELRSKACDQDFCLSEKTLTEATEKCGQWFANTTIENVENMEFIECK